MPLKRVKKRRVIQQPLSDLAVEIIREALEDGKEHVFASPLGDQPMNRKVMATALRGTKHKGKVKTPGICALLGLKPFTPHDLRRTAATLAGDLGFDDAWIAKCLDHAASKKQEQIVPSVTGKVYNHSKRMKEKRAVLDGVAAELRRIIGEARRNRTASRRLCVGLIPLEGNRDIRKNQISKHRNVSVGAVSEIDSTFVCRKYRRPAMPASVRFHNEIRTVSCLIANSVIGYDD